MNSKKLILILFFVTVNLVLSTVSIPFKWRKSARSDSSSHIMSASKSDIQSTPRLIDLSFLQSLPKLVFNPLKKSQQQQTKFFGNINSLERPLNQFDNYHLYETLPSEVVSTSNNFKPSVNKPSFKNELENFNDIYSINEPYEDDDVIVIPFTKHRGPARFGDLDNRIYTGKNEQGVPSAIGYDSNKNKVISLNKKSSPTVNLNRFKSKTITDSEDDLDTGDELPSSLSNDDENDETQDFKVKFSHSNLHPVFVLPPAEFKPVLYPNRQIDGSKLITNQKDDEATIKPLVTDKKQEMPYKYPGGLSSWILGGVRSLSRGAYWEQLANDEALYGYGKTENLNNNSGKKTIEIESSENSLESKQPTFDLELIKESSIKNLNELNNKHDNLEFISLTEPKTGSDKELNLKKTKLNKKTHLISKFNKTSLTNNNLIQRKFNLKPQKLNKILKLTNKPFNNDKKSN